MKLSKEIAKPVAFCAVGFAIFVASCFLLRFSITGFKVGMVLSCALVCASIGKLVILLALRGDE